MDNNQLNRKYYYCGSCKKWFRTKTLFSEHAQFVHELEEGIYPEGSITPK